MLNSGDIDFMAQAQDEIYELRKRPITFIYVGKSVDPITGIEEEGAEVRQDVQAVITEVSIRNSDGSRYMEGGVEYEQGDIKIDVKLSELDEDQSYTRAIFDSKKYELLGGDAKGIGRRNRVEYIGREIA